MYTLQILNDIASQRFYRTCQLPSVQDNEVCRLITSLLWMFRKPFTISSSTACPNMPLFGAPVRDSEGSHLARIARSLNPTTGMRLEVRRSRSSRSSNLFPLASYIPSDQELGRAASDERLIQGRFGSAQQDRRKGIRERYSEAFSSFQEWVLVHS